MPGNDDGFIRQRKKTVADAGEKGVLVAAREVGAANTAGEERVSGEQKILRRNVEAEAAFGVAGVYRILPSRPRMEIVSLSAGEWSGGRTWGVSTPSHAACSSMMASCGRSALL